MKPFLHLVVGEADIGKEYHKAVDPAAIGVSLFPGIVGVSAEVKGHELIDFVLGILTLDPLDDDK